MEVDRKGFSLNVMGDNTGKEREYLADRGGVVRWLELPSSNQMV